MAHRYGDVIVVGTTPTGCPAHITWRGVQHAVTEIFGSWHLRDRWWAEWEAPLTATGADGQEHAATFADLRDASDRAASDRLYYRVQCADGFLCDVYYDRIRTCWVLDRVHD